MNKEEQISKIFYEMEEDTTKIDFDLNQRNIKRRNEIMALLKSSLQEQEERIKQEMKENIEKRKKILSNQPLRWSVKDDIEFLEDILKELNI